MPTHRFQIVFMGTPEFAIPSLQALHRAGHNIAAVVTQPDRLSGRGKNLTPPPVKTAAQTLGLPVLQFETIHDRTCMDRLKSLEPDFFVVIAFGQVLPESVLTLPRFAAVNIHASLLPKYRGPAPIHWSIISGDKTTGVTTMRMDAGVDTGEILLCAAEPIHDGDTAETLHDRLSQRGADLIVPTLAMYADGAIVPKAQDNAAATYAPMLKKSDGRIDWTKPADRIECFIRGMTPWPGAFTFAEDRRLKLFRSEIQSESENAPPGTVLESFPGELLVATGRGALSILELQASSGKRMPITQFLRGAKIPPGTVLR